LNEGPLFVCGPFAFEGKIFTTEGTEDHRIIFRLSLARISFHTTRKLYPKNPVTRMTATSTARA
jgi:hypothetical protein